MVRKRERERRGKGEKVKEDWQSELKKKQMKENWI
jgi:hypothetical protein